MTNALARLNRELNMDGHQYHFAYPSFEITSMPDMDSIKEFEVAARTCYQSESKMTEDNSSGTDLMHKIFKRNHTAMIEFFPDLVVKLRTNRGVSHEAVRHRVCSFAQECVSGDTELKKGFTISDLHETLKTPSGKAHLHARRIKSVDKKGNIVKNKIERVMYKGEALVFELKTTCGYSIKATENHEFLCQDGSYKLLKDLNPGDKVMLNGRPSLVPITDEELRVLYENDQLSPMEIAEKFKTRYRAVVYRLKKLGIFQRRKNDKNPEKYNNQTSESIDKMKRTINEQYKNGRVVWNKGLKEHDHPSVQKQAEGLRENHYDLGHQKEKNGQWKGGTTRRFAYKVVNKTGKCAICGFVGPTEAHHRDSNWRNNSSENLVELCHNCHKKAHHGWYCGTRTHAGEIYSITEIGFEKVYDLSMAAPNHNYVADGFVVHNSTRYVRYGNVPFILPYWASAIDLLENSKRDRNKLFMESCNAASHIYSSRLEIGCSPQEARGSLNNDVATYINVKANLREWFHIFGLRCNATAHPDMRVLMCGLVKWLECNNDLFARILRAHCPTIMSDLDWFSKNYFVNHEGSIRYILPYVDTDLGRDEGDPWS